MGYWAKMKKLFILGIPRSGTTWTFKYIFSKYNIRTFESEEVGFFTKFFGRYGDLKKPTARIKLFNSYRRRFSRDTIHNDSYEVPNSVGYFGFYDSLINQIQFPSTHFVDKTPLNIFIIDKLLDHYGSNADCFIVVRNPLDQAASMTYGSVKLGKWMRKFLPFASLKISYSFELWKKAISIAQNKKIKIFLFENILQDQSLLDDFLMSIGVEYKTKPKLHPNHLKINSSFDRKSGKLGSQNIIDRYPNLVNMVDDDLLSLASQLGYQIPYNKWYWLRTIIRIYVKFIFFARITSLRIYFEIYS